MLVEKIIWIGNLKKNEVKTKMEVAKLELIKIILSLQDGTATNFVRFNSIIEYWRKALHVLDKDSRKEAAKFINSSTPQGLVTKTLPSPPNLAHRPPGFRPP